MNPIEYILCPVYVRNKSSGNQSLIECLPNHFFFHKGLHEMISKINPKNLTKTEQTLKTDAFANCVHCTLHVWPSIGGESEICIYFFTNSLNDKCTDFSFSKTFHCIYSVN